uniref:helix-turn-helix domain-containing protein n=1 Tax=Polaribacter sp. TaxID=1920175 RepID=UPI0040483D3D
MLLVSLFKEISEEALLSGKPMAFFMLFFWLFIFFKVLTSPEILYGLPILNRTLIKFDDFNLNSNNDLFKIGDNWILDAEVKKSNQDQRLEDNIKDNIKGYIIEVDKLSAVKKIFRHQKVSQNEIAAVLGVPTSHIVYLFNYHSKTSFSEYRMNSRIQDAISLMELGFLDNETLESLSNKIGFSSYNPFFTAFRKVTNYAPHEYLKVKKNEL